MAAMYAFSFELANFGIAIDARMPTITTTMSSSIRGNPLVDFTSDPPGALWQITADGGKASPGPPLWHRPISFPPLHLRREERVISRRLPSRFLPVPWREPLVLRVLPAPARRAPGAASAPPALVPGDRHGCES